jgi:asparaginyl-tRNA synthetase
VEFWRVEVASSNSGLDEVICFLENLVSGCCEYLVKNNSEELCRLLRLETLSLVKVPFLRLTYDEALEKLRASGVRVNWGEPFSWDLERRLSLMFDRPFFVREFPVNGENFLFKSCLERSEISLCADLLAPGGYGEIAGGGEVIMDKRELLAKLSEMKIDSADRRWFLGLRRFGVGSQSGFAVGVERLVQWICGLPDVKDAVAFPRAYGFRGYG